MSSDLIAAIQPKLFMSLICALNMVPCWLLRRDMRGPAVRMLNEATLFFGIGLPVLLFKDWLPRTPTVIVGNMLVLAAMTLLWQLVSSFTGRTVDRRLVVVAPLVWLFCWGVPQFRAEYDLRVAVAAGLSGLLISLPVIDVLRAGAIGMPRRLLVATGALHTAISLVRVVLAAQHSALAASTVWVTACQLNTLSYMMLWPALCTMLMNRQSLDAEAERGRHDELSGLLNRRGVLFEIARRGPGALLLFDIDHFKRINDRFGHAAGDEAIVAFAALARRLVGPELALGRIGGEEFVVFVPAGRSAAGTGAPFGRNGVSGGAMMLAETVRAAFAVLVLPAGVSATVSVGVASPIPGEPVDKQLARADRALYLAKRQGRNRIAACDQGVLAGEPEPEASPAGTAAPLPVTDSARLALEAA